MGGLDRSVRLVGRSPGAAVRLERHHVGQAGLAQCEVPVVADGVGTVGDHRPAAEARLLAPGRESGGQLRFRAEGGIGPAAGEVVGGGVGVRVQRVVDAAVGPHRGHRDDAVVGEPPVTGAATWAGRAALAQIPDRRRGTDRGRAHRRRPAWRGGDRAVGVGGQFGGDQIQVLTDRAGHPPQAGSVDDQLAGAARCVARVTRLCGRLS